MRFFMSVMLPEINALVVEHVMSHVVLGETEAHNASAADCPPNAPLRAPYE